MPRSFSASRCTYWRLPRRAARRGDGRLALHALCPAADQLPRQVSRCTLATHVRLGQDEALRRSTTGGRFGLLILSTLDGLIILLPFLLSPLPPSPPPADLTDSLNSFSSSILSTPRANWVFRYIESTGSTDPLYRLSLWAHCPVDSTDNSASLKPNRCAPFFHS
jgi:hypothetical protein